MTDNDIIKSLNVCQNEKSECSGCSYSDDYTNCNTRIAKDALELIYRQKAEIERLHDEVSKTRRKALLEASSKFAGHSDYHGDTILCKLICMAEGKEVEIAKPLDKSEIKSEAIKEFAERLKAIYDDKRYDRPNAHTLILFLFNNIDSLVKEMLGDAIVKEISTDLE